MTSILDIPGSNALNPFTAIFTSVCTSPSSSATINDTVTHIVALVTACRDPNTKLYELWDALFTAVVTHPESHATLLILVNALAAQPPTQIRLSYTAQFQLSRYLQPDGKLDWSQLPRYHDLWRDTHDVLEAWRDWDGVRASGGQKLDYPVSTYYLRFCKFSAAGLKTAEHGKGHNSLSIWVFYACRNVLERKGPEPRQSKPHRLSSEQLWALDVCIAATWLRDGARALYETDVAFLRKHWTAALDDETQLWPCDRGLTRERWSLWEDRLRGLAIDEAHFEEYTRSIMSEAANVVNELLQSN
jgi:hypothetical protein